MPARTAISYRNARVDDADAIAALWTVANRARGAYVSDAHVDIVRQRIVAAGAIGKIAERNGRVVGTATLAPAREDGGRGEPIAGLAHLNGVAVDPHHWGMGIARTMLGLVVEHARDAGFDQLQLYVDESNERARRLYELNDWTATGEAVRVEHGVLLRYVRGA